MSKEVVKRDRRSLVRQLHIHRLILDGKCPTAIALAKSLEVTDRTIRTDLADLRKMLDSDIKYDHSRRTYNYTRPIKPFPGEATATPEDAMALLMATKTVEHHAPALNAPLAASYRRAAAQLKQRDREQLQQIEEVLTIHPFDAEKAEGPLFSELLMAAMKRRQVRFYYLKPGFPQCFRRVDPLNLYSVKGKWYLLAHDHDRKDTRNFAVRRMSRLTVTAETFTRPANFNPRDHFRNGFRAFSGKGNFEVTILLDPWATDMLHGEQVHHSQTVSKMPDGSSQVGFRLGELKEVAEWVLQWRGHARVLGPKELRDMVRADAAKILDLHAD